MSERQDKMASLLTELAAKFIQTEAASTPLITVTRTTVSPDFKNATVYITVYPDDAEEAALIFFKRKGSDFRHSVAEKGGNLKQIPYFEFAIDIGERNRQRLDELAEG